jgi:hypothetical protein
MQGIRDARLELRLDNPAGRLLGTVQVEPTAGRTSYRLTGTTIGAPVRGVHDLALVARGSGADIDGHVFNITWFAFDPKTGRARR